VALSCTALHCAALHCAALHCIAVPPSHAACTSNPHRTSSPERSDSSPHYRTCTALYIDMYVRAYCTAQAKLSTILKAVEVPQEKLCSLSGRWDQVMNVTAAAADGGAEQAAAAAAPLCDRAAMSKGEILLPSESKRLAKESTAVWGELTAALKCARQTTRTYLDACVSLDATAALSCPDTFGHLKSLGLVVLICLAPPVCACRAEDWATARVAKTSIEQAQRDLRKAREDAGEVHTPSCFAMGEDLKEWVATPEAVAQCLADCL
jgi:hypothetical protein